MTRSAFHIAFFTVLALAAPMIAGTAAEARDYRHGEHQQVYKHKEQRRDFRTDGYRRREQVTPRQIVRKLRHRGAYDISPVWRVEGTYRVVATGPRGMRARYVFSARSGELIGVRPIGWSGYHHSW